MPHVKERVLNLLDKKYFSHELKMRKPNLKFFKYVLDDLNTSPLECAFIDDKQKNVDAAKECGMKGIVFSSVNQLKKELASLGVNQF
ncbi:HAD-IA family hydrolase [Candidatus Woesearchaeota archaeon]|nr:HAD-IA family hydrolase [Candidatus Woesearchaeota archaeon]